MNWEGGMGRVWEEQGEGSMGCIWFKHVVYMLEILKE